MELDLWKQGIWNGNKIDYYVSAAGEIANLNWKKLKLRANNRGYIIVDIYVDHIKHTVLLHRLVAETFIPNLNEYPTVNHIDGNKNHNFTINLEWATYSYNNFHAYENGLKISKKGKDSQFAKYSEELVLKITDMLELGKSSSIISKELDCPVSLVHLIKDRSAWFSLTKDRKFKFVRLIMPKEVKKSIYDLYDKGFSVKDICKLLKWSNSPKYQDRILRALEERPTTIP